jgi:hypothetical protein
MRTTLAFFCAVVASPLAYAEGLLFQLPEDGSFVRFSVKTEYKGDLKEKSATGILTMSSVGKETLRGAACRWIEIKSVETVGSRQTTSVSKILLPVRLLAKGKDPLDETVRAWMKRSIKENDKSVDLGVEKDPDPKLGLAGPIPLYLCGPLDDAKSMGKEIVETKTEKLECEIHTGKKKFTFGGTSFEVRFKTWVHEKAPFGVMKAHWTVMLSKVTMEMTYEFMESGKNAKSELTENR